jgi:hypothetical protein
LFGAQLQLPPGAQVFVGMLFEPNDVGPENGQPVFVSDLNPQGNIVVPEGARFLDADAYFLAMVDRREPSVFVDGPTEVSISFAGKMAVPLFGPEGWVLVSVEAIQDLQANSPMDSGFIDFLLSMAFSLDDSLDGTLAGETIADSVLEQISNFNPATVKLDVTTPLTVAQAVALEQAGFDLADKVSFSVRDFVTTVQAANASPAEKLIMLEATQVTAVGNELGSSVDLMAFDSRVQLRLEAGAGDDQILAGRANDVIVGQAGADLITLTTLDTSADTIVYQSRFDGGSLPVTALRYAQDEITGEDSTNYYREGSQLRVNINGVWSDYTMTGEDSAQEALAKLANEIMREHQAMDPAQVLAGFLMPAAVLSVFVNGVSLELSLLSALNNPVTLDRFNAKGEFEVPAGFVLLPPGFGEPIAFAGQKYSLTGQHIIEVANLLVNNQPSSLLANAGYTYTLGEATNNGLSVRWENAKLIAAEVQPDNTINLVGAQVDTPIFLSGGNNVEIDNPGQATVRTVTFSGEAGQYVRDGADHKLRVTISFDDDNNSMTADKQVTVEALIVGEDPSDSVAALAAAINTNTEVNSWVTASVGEDNTMLTLTGDNNGLNSFNLSGAEIDTHGAQQKTSASFSTNNDDYYAKLAAVVQGSLGLETTLTFTAKEEAVDPLSVSAELDYFGVAQQAKVNFNLTDADYFEGGKLSLTIDTPNGEPVTITADMVADSYLSSVSALRAAVQAEFEKQESPLKGVIGQVSGTAGSVTLTASQGGAESFEVTEATTTVAAVKQVTEINFSGTDDDDFTAFATDGEDAGTISVSIAGQTITADMADTKVGTLANLQTAIEAEMTSTPAAVSISRNWGQFNINDSLYLGEDDYLSINGERWSGEDAAFNSVFTIGDLVAYLDESEDLAAEIDEEGRIVISTEGKGVDQTLDISWSFAGEDSSAGVFSSSGEDSDTGKDGLLSDVLGSVSLSKDMLTLTAKIAGVDPLNVTGLTYSTPDLTETAGLLASRPHTVLMNFNNTTLDGLLAGDTVSVLIDGITTTLTIGSDPGQVNLSAVPLEDRSTAVLQALVTSIGTDHGNTTALGSAALGYVSQGLFKASGATPGSFDTSLLLTAKLTGDSAYAVHALGEVGTDEIGITIVRNAATVSNPGSTERVQLGNLVWAGEGTSSGVSINSEAIVGKAQYTLVDDESDADLLAVDNSVITGESGGVFAENLSGDAVLNNEDGTLRGVDTGTRVNVDANLAVGEKPGTAAQGSVNTVHDGFDAFNIDGRYLALALGAEADLVRNFQTGGWVGEDYVGDQIVLEGMLAQQTASEAGVVASSDTSEFRYRIDEDEQFEVLVFDFDRDYLGGRIELEDAENFRLTDARSGETLAQWDVEEITDDYFDNLAGFMGALNGTQYEGDQDIELLADVIDGNLHIYANRDGVELEDSQDDIDIDIVLTVTEFDLSTVGYGLVQSAESTLDAQQLGDADDVTRLLNNLFAFSGSANDAINSSIFAVTAADDQNVTAIWAHLQSSADDQTVTVDEMSLLAIVHTIGGEFGLHNFLSEPQYATIPG